MEVWQGIILGLVQGLAEFLPISSSGHLFLGEYFLGLEPNIDFMIALHIATLGAVVLVYWRKIFDLLIAWVRWFLNPREKNIKAILAWQLILATLVTVIVALLIEPYFETILNLQTVAVTLVLTGILILVSELLSQKKNTTSLSWGSSVLLGISQGLAVIPGISRSGITIAYLLSTGVKRKEAADISFLLSIPTILGAGVFMLKGNDWQLTLSLSQWIGCGVAFCAATGAIFWMKNWVETKWMWFAPYCFVVAITLVLIA